MSNEIVSQLDVADYLKSTIGADDQIYYRPNQGNAGDALMATATFDMFDSLGFDYTAIFQNPTNEDFSRHVLVLGGGGNFNETGYNRYAEIVARWHQKVKRLVILPHTVSGNEALLSSLGNNVDIICRERKSYDHVKKHAGRANVMLAHDMAFSLDVQKVRSRQPNYPMMLAKRSVTSALRLGARKNYPNVRDILQDFQDFSEMKHNPKGNGVLNVFRVDIEKTEIKIPEDNIDLSLRFQYGLSTRQLTDYMTGQVFSYLDHFHTIRTNRLHICIAAALLGKTVELFANNYHKIQSVYEHSLKEAFPNVIWHS